jgi:O-acetyl-ADP-ribose deacetylase
VAIPAISSGIFGYPKDLCAYDIFQAIVNMAKDYKNDPQRQGNLKLIRLTNFDQETVGYFQREFDRRFKHGKPSTFKEPMYHVVH